jgi:hypothetical protein
VDLVNAYSSARMEMEAATRWGAQHRGWWGAGGNEGGQMSER